MAFFSMSTKFPGQSKVETSGSSLTFLAGSSQTNAFLGENPLALPRVGIDGFPTKGLSVGGSFAFFGSGGTVKSGGSEDDLASSSGFLIAPRVGYAAMFSNGFGIWPRVGFTYVSEEIKSSAGNVSLSMQEIDVEIPIVISPWSHFAFTVGPVMDFSVGASLKASAPGGGASQKVDFSFSTYGAMAGLVGYL